MELRAHQMSPIINLLDWRDIIYTDGSVMNKILTPPPLLAQAFKPSKEDLPSEQHTSYIKPNGCGPTNTIDRAELAGILVALMKEYKVTCHAFSGNALLLDRSESVGRPAKGVLFLSAIF